MTFAGVNYLAIVIAAVTFYADWKFGWEKTKGYTTVACVVYFTVNTLLTYHIWRVEAGRVFVGSREGGQQVNFFFFRCLVLSLGRARHIC